MAKYHFVTYWQFEAPLEQVWRIIKKMDAWPEWWPYVKEVELLQSGDEDDLGSIRRITWSTALPYSLTFDSELIALEKYRRMEGRAFGELEGKGIWIFKQDGPTTLVQYDWIVQTTKWWMNALSPIARPLFAWNHDKVMAGGYHGLTRRLEKQL